MKIKIILSFSVLLFCGITFAETITFKTQPIPSKYTSFSGEIPFIETNGFNEINKTISNDLLADQGTQIDFSSEKIYQDHQYMTIRIHLEIEGGRSYHRERYYIIDLKNKELVSLNQILKKYQLSAPHISEQIAKKLEPCIKLTTPRSEECDSADMEFLYRDFAEDRHIIDLKNADGFYLKKDILGISFDTGAFSVPFEYNLKTQKIQ